MWNLPPDSALIRALSGGWTTDNELAALNAEISYEILRAQLAVGGVKKHRLPQPLHVPRPSAESTHDSTQKPERREATPAEVMAILAAGFGQRG